MMPMMPTSVMLVIAVMPTAVMLTGLLLVPAMIPTAMLLVPAMIPTAMLLVPAAMPTMPAAVLPVRAATAAMPAAVTAAPALSVGLGRHRQARKRHHCAADSARKLHEQTLHEKGQAQLPYARHRFEINPFLLDPTFCADRKVQLALEDEP